MANWSEAFSTLGRGLQTFAVQRLDREAREVERMREEAFRRIEREDQQAHQAQLQAGAQAHATELFEIREGMEQQRQGEVLTHQKEMQSQQIGAQERIWDKRTQADAVEGENRNLTSLLTSIQDSREKLSVEEAKLKAEGFADPEGLQAFTELRQELDERERQARRNHVLNTRRILSGGYGKTEVLTPDQVKKIIGEKNANTEAGVETPPEEGPAPTRPPSEKPRPAAAPAGEPQAAAPQEQSSDLFRPVSFAEMAAKGKRAASYPRPSISETVGGFFERMKEHRARVDARLRQQQEEEARWRAELFPAR